MAATNKEILESFKLCVLDEKRHFLCLNLTPKDHYPYLRSSRILTEDDEELIELQQLRKQKVHKFLDILIKRGPKGYDELVKSILLQTTQIFVVEQLNKAYEEKQKRFLALLKDSHTPVQHSISTTDTSLSITDKLDTPSIGEPDLVFHCDTSEDVSVSLCSLPIPVMLSSDKTRTQKNEESSKRDKQINPSAPKSVDENDEDSSIDGQHTDKESLA